LTANLINKIFSSVTLSSPLAAEHYLKDFLTSFYKEVSFSYVLLQHCFICCLSDSTVSEDAGIGPWTVANFSIGSQTTRLYNHSAGSHPYKEFLVNFENLLLVILFVKAVGKELPEKKSS
jgi:hypothetical protein